jgi:Putative beta barrel porin-7 (BBP7)
MRRLFVLLTLLAGLAPATCRAQSVHLSTPYLPVTDNQLPLSPAIGDSMPTQGPAATGEQMGVRESAYPDPLNPLVRWLIESEAPDQERGRFQLDFLYWWLDKLRVPPLVTTGPSASQAIFGQPGTEVLRGDGPLDSRHGRYIGGRFGGDWWFDRDTRFGINGSIALLERDSSNLTFRPHTITPLARPYLDANDGQWHSFIVAGSSPQFGELSGSINVYSRIEFFGEDVNGLLRLGQGETYRVNLLAGAHFLQLRERLDITGTSRILPDEGTLIGVTDHFTTFNKFYGGQMGLSGWLRRGRWSLEGKGVVALGADVQEIRAKGDRVFHTLEGRTTENFGLLVLPSNTGDFQRTTFDVVTEWGLNLGWSLNSRFQLRAGYSLLTWNNPVRPGDQIQPIDLSQIGFDGPTPKASVPFRTDFFWAQGLNFGLLTRW